jgi:predicted alpha/beta superfamily hydrolase
MTKVKTGFLVLAALVVAAGVGGLVGGGAAIALVKTAYNSRPVEREARSELVVHSEVLGESMVLGVRLPLEYAADPGRRFPVLWVLDGRGQGYEVYRTTQVLSRIGVAEPSIVIEVPHSGAGRTEDFTPPGDVMSSDARQGDRLLRFLEAEAIPAVEQAYRADSARVLVGHSLGGLFALYTLGERPALFDGYFSFSPSVWVGDEAIVTFLEGALGQPEGLRNFLYLSLGSEEGNEMLSGFEALREALEQAPSELDWQMDITPGADHGSNPRLSYPVAASLYWSR